MYHHVSPPPAGARIRGMYVSPRQFDWQLGWLKSRGYEFCTFEDLSAPHPPAVRRVVLTLDDGYLNNYEQAFPILRKHDARAVVYPILNDLGRQGVTWPGATEQTPADMMTAGQIREMADAGIEFGSHLLEHRRLTEMSEAEQIEQLTASKARLETIIGRPILSIAYPYGAYDDGIVQRAGEAGYRFGVTTEPGTNSPDGDALRLRRYTAKGCKFYHPLKFTRMIRAAERQD
jgi:peptidoglycan/xylan/chitin deacetylase (PgdA/CDA1 family)